MANSNAYLRKSKRFPLYRHSNGSWCKRINGRLYYFGKDKTEALERYDQEREAIRAGRIGSSRKVVEGEITVCDLLTQFLRHKLDLVESGDLVQTTYEGYKYIARTIREAFGDQRRVSDLRSSDFAELRKTLAKDRTAKTLDNLVTRIRVVFRFAYEEELIDKPIRFRKTFSKPKKAQLRKERFERGDMSFSAAELRSILKAAIDETDARGHKKDPDYQLRAMILIAVQSGMGNSDLGSLRFKNVDLKNGWINCPRNKNANPRRFPLWPETIEAIRQAIKNRPTPASDDDKDVVFITRRDRRRWHVDGKLNSLGLQFRKLLERGGYYRKGRSFYSLRRTFATVGSEVDQVACSHIMGHIAAADDMAAVYRQHVKDERLQRVVDHVHGWLFGEGGAE